MTIHASRCAENTAAAVAILNILVSIRIQSSQDSLVQSVWQQYRPTKRRWPSALPVNISTYHCISGLYSSLNV
jgi:hypothetical protein